MWSQQQFQTSGYNANLKAAAATISLAIAFLATILVTPVLSAQQLNQLTYFTGPNGNSPNGDLTLDAAGNVYGTTFYGGEYGTDGPGTVARPIWAKRGVEGVVCLALTKNRYTAAEVAKNGRRRRPAR